METTISEWDRRYLLLAEHISTWSKYPRTKVGAVITRDKYLVSVGFNGFPPGIKDDERLDNREEALKIVQHAELNAILTAAQNLSDCTIYTWPFSPCSQCAGSIIHSGIKRVVTIKAENKLWGSSFLLAKNLFEESGVDFYEVDKEHVSRN